MNKTEARQMAYNTYIKGMGNISKKKIAEDFGVSISTVSRWASQDCWDNVISTLKCSDTEQKSDANVDSIISLLPKETADIINVIENSSPAEILWQNILLQYAAIIRAQRVMDVDGDILQIEKRKINNMDVKAKEWENFTPWERYKIFMDTQSKAMQALTSMLKRFDEYKKNGLASEELCAKIALIKNKTEALSARTENVINVVASFGKDDD